MSQTLDNAQKYLAKVVPWPQNENDGYVGLHWTVPGRDGGKPYWTSRAVRSIDEAVRTLNWAQSLPDTRDVYLCLSRQRHALEKTSQKGRKYLTSVRSQENAIELKSLYIDVDVKGGPNGYADQNEAVRELARFLKETKLPKPSVIVLSGGGLHVYFTLDRPLPVEEWCPHAFALAEAGRRHELRFDAGCTTDSARVLRIPDTKNFKTDPPRPVGLAFTPLELDYSVEYLAALLEPYKTNVPALHQAIVLPANFQAPSPSVIAKFPLENDLAAGIEKEFPPIKLDDVAKECAFVRDAVSTGGKAYDQFQWNLTTLIATFTEGGRADAHRMGDKHPDYTKEGTDEMFDRKDRERREKGLGWPSCASISTAGCRACQSCKHFAVGKTPLHFAERTWPTQPLQSEPAAALAEPFSFADPWAEFVGPPFPVQVLPPPLASFVNAEHCAMGADPSALAMAALTVVAGALHAETCVRAGEGWDEKPIMWTALVGPPSAMKSPIIQKVTSPLRKIDHLRHATWAQQYATWKQNKVGGTNPGPCPAKRGRLLIQDVTPEKVAEILSRDSAGSLMVHDELAALLGSFERYNSGQSSRAFFLSCWNGGPFLKDRVGQGTRDDCAEIRVDNLALAVLGGIQPDRLAAIRDLTSDGLLQRFLPVLMRAPERGDENRPVSAAENDYAKFIELVQGAPSLRYKFAADAANVRRGVLDRLFSLEQVDGFSGALIGAIGKLKGYYARLALTLHVAAERTAIMQGQILSYGADIPRGTAEAAEQLVFDFLLPHIFGLYDVVANGGKERESVRAIASFILASDKDRLRPSDLTAGVRKLRGEPQNKIAEWASRFCAMGWLRPESENTTTPSAWLVVPGLREHFAHRREQARLPRAQAHAILKGGGTQP